MTNKATYDAAFELYEEKDPELSLITRAKSAFLFLLGFPGALGQVLNPHLEWNDDALLANSSTLNGAVNASATTINVAAGHGARFRAGDILQSDGSRELISVTSISTDALTVVRGIRGTTGEAVADLAAIRIMNNPAIEDETAPDARNTSRVNRDNYTEIFREVVSVTRSKEISDNVGVDSELGHQVMTAKMDLVRRLAYTIYNGKRQSSNPVGTASQARATDGIIQQILTGSDSVIIDAGGATLTEALLNQGLREAFEKGGTPNTIVTSTRQQSALDALMEGRQRFGATEGMLGAVVQRFASSFGMQQVAEPDLFCPSDTLLCLDMGKLELVKLGAGGDAFEEIDLARTGLSERRLIAGEFGLKARNAQDGGHVLIHNLGNS